MWVGFIEVNLIFLEVFFIKQELLINEKIRAKEVQLIGANGEKLGVVGIEEALDMAAEAKLDLALVSPNAQPPVCKLMNYGKYKFEQAKREKESKKNMEIFSASDISGRCMPGCLCYRNQIFPCNGEGTGQSSA